MKKVLLSILYILLKIVLVMVAIFVIYYVARSAFDSSYKIMSKTPSSDIVVRNVDIKIQKGATTRDIAEILEQNNLINSIYYFLFYSRISGWDGNFQQGEFTLNTGMSEEEIAKILMTQGERRETVSFVIPEGYTVQQIARRLSNKGLCTEAEFLEAVNTIAYDYKFIEQIPDRNIKLQGYLFPATYEVYEDASAIDIVSTMLKKFDQVFKPEFYDRAESLGFTIDEIITIASIIEREVVVPEEREKVASVIYNRLNIDMKLQMCSTVMYALDKPRERLLNRDLLVDSKFNTYKYPGLPIGPIANPGEASIIAALYPADTDYLYFVINDNYKRSHEFNTTHEAHIRAKNRYNQKF